MKIKKGLKSDIRWMIDKDERRDWVIRKGNKRNHSKNLRQKRYDLEEIKGKLIFVRERKRKRDEKIDKEAPYPSHVKCVERVLSDKNLPSSNFQI